LKINQLKLSLPPETDFSQPLFGPLPHTASKDGVSIRNYSKVFILFRRKLIEESSDFLGLQKDKLSWVPEGIGNESELFCGIPRRKLT